MNTAELARFLITADFSNPMDRGRATALVRTHKAASMSPTRDRTLDQAIGWISDRLAAVAAITDGPLPRPSNPLNTGPAPAKRQPGPLTTAEFELIRRLPLAPAEVSVADAQWLRTLRSGVESRDEGRFVDSVLAPVERHHATATARAEAEFDLAAVARPAGNPSLPPGAREAQAARIGGLLADRVAAESPELTGSEAGVRSTEMARGVVLAAEAERQGRVVAARAVLAGLDGAAA